MNTSIIIFMLIGAGVAVSNYFVLRSLLSDLETMGRIVPILGSCSIVLLSIGLIGQIVGFTNEMFLSPIHAPWYNPEASPWWSYAGVATALIVIGMIHAIKHVMQLIRKMSLRKQQMALTL